MNINYKKILVGLAMSCAVMTSCEDEDYVDANVDPDTMFEILPENQFLHATINVHNQDFEAFYDFYQGMHPFMQYTTPLNGNAENFTGAFAKFWRYDRLYVGVGNTLTDLEKLVALQPTEQQPRYVRMINIARILKAYYTFYVSDIFGSIPYSEAFQARYGGTLTPKFDTQQELFARLDAELKAAIETLKQEPELEQINLGRFDQYFNGDHLAWIKAGNALRLRMATRLVKRDRATATRIASEVLSDPASLMQNNGDGWYIITQYEFTGGGNFNPDGIRPSKPLVDFMVAKEDPRLDIFVEPNEFSQANIDRIIADGNLPAGTKATNRYVGSPTSPDAAQDEDVQKVYYSPTPIKGSTETIDTLSLIQRRLFQPAFNSGRGTNYIPVITFADFCFNRAELAALNVTTESAADLYVQGVTASIEWYNEAAVAAVLQNFTPVVPAEITAYLAKPDVAFEPGRALEQIAAQTYLNSFRQPAEGWAVWKRTGFPSAASTVLPLEDMKSNGVSLEIPRRAPLIMPREGTPNYENVIAAQAQMAQEPGYGSGPQDLFGRVWWDAE